jgi:hypothetical protein
MPEAPQIALEGEPLLNIHLRALTEGIAGNGVVNQTDLEVTVGSGDLDIDVAAGGVYLDGAEYSYGGGTSVATLSTGDGTYDRWDTVAFDTGTLSVVVHEGTPAQYPTASDIQPGEIALAAIYVASGATAISSGDITNIRTGFSNEAEQVHYNDSTGTYGIDDVSAALDDLQEAVQVGSYPLIHGTDTDAPTGAHHTPPASDTATASGDGSATTFTLSHSLGSTPTAVSVDPTSADAAGEFYVSNKTSTDVDVTYTSAPPSGTDNLSWDIITVV